jgi:putative transposase
VHGLSERSACRALGAPRATHRYDSRRPGVESLASRLRELAIQRPRFGYRRLYLLLRREGVVVNHKRVYRVYRSEGLTVRIKRRKRLAAAPRVAPVRPNAPGKRWSMDFATDRTSDGHRFRVLTIVDDFSRRSPGAVVERSIGGARVAPSSTRLPPSTVTQRRS